METTIVIPEKEMRVQAENCLHFANSFLSTLQKSLVNEKSRFDNDMLYNLAVMSTEKYFVALLARYDWNATHHMPISLFKEALTLDPELPVNMKQTAILVGKFEAICSLDGFGYHTPSTEELQSMSVGLQEIKEWVEMRMSEI
jgi:hypothetical protein